ncbi:serine/threonine-protein kinase Nek8-like [Macrosteles quadrilineatus]|uniref:serine/threonine-protein kinase Nek8-like n=1 Tax=Macrosteles quadrilineatus TaxID=74068 RepID=UPI0023E0E4D5|nr:serine/threonine-protein kinase Nek8-like [Macrosteles quadrilineatus]
MEEYDKLVLVGRGAFGTVYLCRKGSGERVILKQIVIEHLNEKELKDTVQEVKVMSLLKHPHIIRYQDSFISQGALVIVMEYATKGTLYEYLQIQSELLPQEKVLSFFTQLCLALQYIHSKKILHRDITTRNILLTGSQGQIIKLTDFGISKMLTSRSKTSSVVGTPCYLSPELCQGKAYGTHSDVWALGCVLYNMCTLRQPFQAQTLAAVVMEIMHGAIEPISPLYDSGIMEILGLMLDRDPLNRPSVDDVLSHRLVAPVALTIITSLGSLAKRTNQT